ncbi:T9SS type A sorting domain-containing protein [Flavobacterium sp. MFBS3-15]|uniref:T9SS type A sorting domain-containing protein n=1 Tax=Flavobacterium sp. MFBS3-15 TaxID=2989816 RepID=UPI0022356B82|nr:T9SS type A sorting domain-containing protein [Flavobacterium sp. MFBS3-15]MCW4470295.1 T9SS type A sorting domain-containing protein [Flavobacterium sp. MFBS3-15]
MKKITILALLLMAGVSGHAQYSYEATDDYGRLEGITYDLETANKLYAVSLNNHIVVSYDNGVTWDLLFAYPNTGARLTNLRMLPGNENLCFSVLNLEAENGIHIFNVEDGEIISTIPMPVLEGDVNVNNFDVYDSEASTIILNISNSGHKVFYTTTGGENWTQVYDAGDYNDVAIQSVAISPNDPTKLFMTRGGGPTDVDGGIFISVDSGETWTEKLTGVILNPIAFKPGVPSEIMVGTDMFDFDTDQNLYRSTDGGETWNIVPSTWTDMVTDHFTVIKYHPTNPEIIYVLEENEIGFSEDGGTTWQITAYPEEVYYAGLSVSVNPFQNKEAVITANMYPVKTADGGLTLTQVKAPFYNIASLSAVKFGTAEHLYYGAQGGLLHKDYTTGETDAYNIESAATFSPSQNVVFADALNEGRLFIYEGGWIGGNLYVSTDHGATRSTLISASGISDVATHPGNDNIVYAVLEDWGNGSVRKLDITDLENVVDTPIITPGEDGPIGGVLVYADHVIVAKNGTVYKTTDDGANWTELYTVTGTTIADIAANPLTAGGFGIATGNGVYTTADGGATWTSALEGANARKLEFSDLDAGVMAVGLYNSVDTEDAYISYYNGGEWITVSAEELNYIHSYGMGFNFIGDNINAYIGTVDMGVIRYIFPIEELSTDSPAIAANKVILAPNPASDIFTVQTSQLIEVKNVTIYSITGQKVVESAQPTINVSHLGKGVYVVKAETASGEAISAKLVKK